MDEAERCSHVAYIYYASSSPTARPIRFANSRTSSPPARCALKSPHLKSRAALRFAVTSRHTQRHHFGQSIHALIEDRFNLNDLREQLMKNGITVTEIRPLAPSLEDGLRRAHLQASSLLEAPVRNLLPRFGAVFYKEVCTSAATPQRSFSLSSSPAANGCARFRIDTNIRQINTVVLNADAAARARVDRPLKKLRTFHIKPLRRTDRDLNDASLPERTGRHQDSRGLF